MSTPISTSTNAPYEMHAQGGGGFTTFEAGGEAVALPLLHLGKATLRGLGGQRVTLEYSTTTVVTEGESLADLFGHLLTGRVRVIRPGQHQGCTVRHVQVIDSE